MLVRRALRHVDFWLSSAVLHTGQLLASELDFIPEPLPEPSTLHEPLSLALTLMELVMPKASKFYFA